MLASFLIPIRMLSILGEKGPHTFSTISLEIQSKEHMVLLFFSLIILIIVAYLILDRLRISRQQRCSKDIWQNNQKLLIYSNQEDLATTIYSRYLQSLGGFGFFILIVSLLGYIYPIVAIVILTYWIIAFIVVSLLYDRFKTIRIKINEDLSKTITLLSMISFLAIFLVIMFDHISSNVTVTLITAVISLILIRHLLGNILTFVQGIKYLYEHKHRINIIFFSGLHAHTLANKA